MFDVIVIGAGHAGCEAAAAAARAGASVALLSFAATDAGQMSCNPSIGGVGKGHLVRELDVFDGLMARAADRATIHRRMLNRSKGPAVWGPRVQADRALYRSAIGQLLDQLPMTRLEGEAAALRLSGDRVTGVILADASVIPSRAVIIATGTFLDARIFIGHEQKSAGRIGEKASRRLAHQVRVLGLSARRLKTGTPPRLDGRSIDWSRLKDQPGDKEPWRLSSSPPERTGPPQIRCAVTRTNLRTHDIIRAAQEQSPLYSGKIEGRGPRYCPSIEDKVRRFGDREGHQVFLEPESLTDALVYPNGISTSMPGPVQEAIVRSIAGLERAVIARPGYAVEYEHVDPRHLGPDLQTRDIGGLFLAGQINGTTGYEEAAAQGLVAGINAAAIVAGRKPVHFSRRESYIGVMIDDLTLQGVTEPYRMMTARAEFRLALRADNAIARLSTLAEGSGVISPARQVLNAEHMALRAQPDFAQTEEGQADLLYAPFVLRQEREWQSLGRRHALNFPSTFNFARIAGLSTEMVERLAEARPADLDQASRIPGITPAALTVLHVALKRVAA